MEGGRPVSVCALGHEMPLHVNYLCGIMKIIKKVGFGEHVTTRVCPLYIAAVTVCGCFILDCKRIL